MRTSQGTIWVGMVSLLLVACGGEVDVATPTPSAPPPTASESPPIVDITTEGHQLFVAKGCSACHGQDAEGTAIAPSLANHSEAVVKRQVRAPVGIMPVFPPDKLSNDELDRIADYVASLSGAHAHVRVADLGQEVALHHWMALVALDADEVSEAIHHVDHIIPLVQGEHLAQMKQVLQQLQEGHVHDTLHTIEGMLAGSAMPELSSGRLHLQLALSAARIGNAPQGMHHTEHFLEGEGAEASLGQDVRDLFQEGDFQGAAQELEGLLQEADNEQGAHEEDENHAQD